MSSTVAGAQSISIFPGHVYNLLEKDCQLEPKGLKKWSFVFATPKLTKDKLLILINGAGVVRAGQWSR